MLRGLRCAPSPAPPTSLSPVPPAPRHALPGSSPGPGFFQRLPCTVMPSPASEPPLYVALIVNGNEVMATSVSVPAPVPRTAERTLNNKNKIKIKIKMWEEGERKVGGHTGTLRARRCLRQWFANRGPGNLGGPQDPSGAP